MLRNQVYLTEQQVLQIDLNTSLLGIGKSEFIRRVLDDYFLRQDRNHFRIVEEDKRTRVKIHGSWLKTLTEAKVIMDSLGKKKSHVSYYIEQKEFP